MLPSYVPDNIKQQQPQQSNQMYMRLPNLFQSGKPGYPGSYPPNIMPPPMMNPGPYSYHPHPNSQYSPMPPNMGDYPGHMRPGNYFNYPPNLYKYPERPHLANVNANNTTAVTQSITVPLPASVSENRQSFSSNENHPLTSEESNFQLNTSHSDDRSETPKQNHKTISHPSTPNPLGSPGAASISSFHEDFENASSPSWPRTPASPAVNSGESNHSKSSSKKGEVFAKLYEMGEESERKSFLDKLVAFNEERGHNHTQCPSINKQLIDLFKLYSYVKENGGFSEITKSKKWKDAANYVLGKDASSPMAYTLRKQYIKHLLPFECKFDRGGIDTQQLLNQVDTPKEKKKTKKSAPSPCAIDSNSQSSYPQAATPVSSDGSNLSKPTNGQSSMSTPTPTAPIAPNVSNTSNSSNAPISQPNSDNNKFNPGTTQVSNQTSTQTANNSIKSPIQNKHQYLSNYESPKHSLPSSGLPNNYPNATYPHTVQGSIPSSGYYPPQHHYMPNQPYDNQQVKSDANPDLVNRPSSHVPSNFTRLPIPNYYNSQTGPYIPTPRNEEYPPYSQSHTENIQNNTSNEYSHYSSNHPQIPPSSQHHFSNSEHYQTMNISRTQSPLAQRLMQQKPIMTPNYPNNNHQSPIYSGVSMNAKSPHSDAHPLNVNNSSTKDVYPNYQKRHDSLKHSETQPPVHNQMMYHPQGIIPPTSQYPYHHGFRPSSSAGPYSFENQNASPHNNSNWNDSNYKMQNYNPVSISSMPPPQQSFSINNQIQQQTHSSTIPSNKPQYLLNLLANNTGTSSAPSTPSSAPAPVQSQINSHLSQSLPSIQSQTVSTSIIPPIPTSTPTIHAPTASPLLVGQQISPSTVLHHPSNQSNYNSGNHVIPSTNLSVSTINNSETLQFPSGSIEAVQPSFVKRKKFTSKDINQVEAWRLMMSLKSGLLAESTWALDVLSILIHDDNTYLYFTLQKLPGLLDILLEYYKHYLNEVFPNLFPNDNPFKTEEKIVQKNSKNTSNSVLDKKFEKDTINRLIEKYESKFKEDENSCLNKDLNSNCVSNESSENNLNEDENSIHKNYSDVNTKLVNGLFDDSENEFKKPILSSKNNYTFITRTGKTVKIMPDENLFVVDFEKSWDIDGELNKTKNKNFFNKGYASITDYIQTHFEVKQSSLQFARNLDKRYSRLDDNVLCNDKENDTNKQNKLIDENQSDEKLDSQENCNIYPKLRSNNIKRKFTENYESEAFKRDMSPLCTLSDYNETISRRCICISTLIRNMSFVATNEIEFSKYRDLLYILGKLLLLHHHHLEKKVKPKSVNLKQLEETLFNEIENTQTTEQLNNLAPKKSNLSNETIDYLLKDEWWWDTLHYIRENTLVTLANISGKLDLSKYSECISLSIFDGLLHWAVCPSSDAQDHLPSTSLTHLSPKRLSLECLAKLSILEENVDLIISTPPWKRMLQLFKCTVDQLSRDQDQTLREFALVLLHNLAISDVAIARAIAITNECIIQLICFIELAEQNAMNVINTQGAHALKENPECMGTTYDMVKRAAACLRCFARIPENRCLFFNYQQRLISFLMSQALHPSITNIIADILYECSLDDFREPINQCTKTTSENSSDNIVRITT